MSQDPTDVECKGALLCLSSSRRMERHLDRTPGSLYLIALAVFLEPLKQNAKHKEVREINLIYFLTM